MRKLWISSLFMLVVVVSACGSVSTSPTSTSRPTPTLTSTPTSTPTPAPLSVVKDPSTVRGIGDGVVGSSDQVQGFLNKFPSPDGNSGLSWVRLSYSTCGSGNNSSTLESAINNYHKDNVRVLLVICQGSNIADLQSDFQDRPSLLHVLDAVQCGNEQMKGGAPTYMSPENFAKFYDSCEQVAHFVRKNIPVLLGSIDPQVAGSPAGRSNMQKQVGYLDTMQRAMRNQPENRPDRSRWDWHQQRLGLVDDWHNGYGNTQYGTNNLLAQFNAWAKNLDGGLSNLGNHLWVTEGSPCYNTGCGLSRQSEIAKVHILTLITDVRTALKNGVPFFYFSAYDFADGSMGVLKANGDPKPLRQDLPNDQRRLTLFCSGRHVSVNNQAVLLADLYGNCTFLDDYSSISHQMIL